MGRYFEGLSMNSYLSGGSSPISAHPFTLAAWVRPEDASFQWTILALADIDTASRYAEIRLRGDLAGDPVEACVCLATERRATSTVGYSTGNWQHVCGTFGGLANRSVYLNGANKVTSTGSIASFPATDRFDIGRRGGNSPGPEFAGDIAEAAAWNVALGDADVADLAAGKSPLLIQPANLVAYYPLLRDVAPRVGGITLSSTNTSASAHPSIQYPRPSDLALVIGGPGLERRVA